MSPRLLLKRSAQTVSLVIALPFALLCGFGRIRTLFNIFGHLYALYPAALGNLLRAGYYRLTLRDGCMLIVSGEASVVAVAGLPDKTPGG